MPPLTTDRHGPVVARERPAGYEAAPPPSGPVGLPAALRELLGVATDVDRGLARMLRLLVQLQSSGEVEARADALVDICAGSLAGTAADGQSSPAKPSVIGTVSIETLLGLSHTPGQLLTRMTGGRLRVDAATARRLIDEGGAQLRTIVIDETGRALGVGKKSYVPPGWVRDAVLALQHDCGTPGCRVAARSCDLDHVEPWPDGGTDVNDLEFQCRRNHVEKTAGVWQVTVLADGTRRHRHVRSGLTTDVPLATRPLGAPALQPPRVDPPDVEPPELDPPRVEPPEPDPPERRP